MRGSTTSLKLLAWKEVPPEEAANDAYTTEAEAEPEEPDLKSVIHPEEED